MTAVEPEKVPVTWTDFSEAMTISMGAPWSPVSRVQVALQASAKGFTLERVRGAVAIETY
jgi:hypothetical protein